MKNTRSSNGKENTSRKKSAGNAAQELKMFNTINETAKISGLSSKYLRRLLKESRLPGIYCGTRFMVNYPEFIKAVSADSSRHDG